MMRLSVSAGRLGVLERSAWIVAEGLRKEDAQRKQTGLGRARSVGWGVDRHSLGGACECCWATTPLWSVAAEGLVAGRWERGDCRYGDNARGGRRRRLRRAGLGARDDTWRLESIQVYSSAARGERRTSRVGGGLKGAVAAGRVWLEEEEEEEEEEVGGACKLGSLSRFHCHDSRLWSKRQPRGHQSPRRSRAQAVRRSVIGRPVGLADTAGRGEQSCTLSPLSPRLHRCPKLLAQRAHPTRFTGNSRKRGVTFSTSNSEDYLEEDFLDERGDGGASSSSKSSAPASAFYSSPWASSSSFQQMTDMRSSLSSNRLRGGSDLGRGSLFYIERQKKRGLVRILRYWLSFGVLTAASAFCLEQLLQPRLRQVPSGTISGGFGAIVSAIALVNFLRMKLMSLQTRGGSGAAIAGELGAKEADPVRHSDLISIICNISLRAGIPCPHVFVVPCRELNAFATGFSATKDASISVTQGLLDMLSDTELSAVAGHEIGHIINGDMRSGTHMASLLMGFYGVFMLGMRLWEAASLHSARRLGGFGLGVGDRELESVRSGDDLLRTDGEEAPPSERDAVDLRMLAIPMIGVGLVAYAVGTVMQRAVSRSQELSADSIGVALTDAESLKTALQKISDGHDGGRRPRDLQRMYQARHIAHMFIHRSSAFSLRFPGFLSRLLTVFSTHPPTEVRVKEINKVNLEIHRLDAA